MSGEQLWPDRPLPGARLNMSHPLTKGLVGCWLLNEQGIRAMDLSPYANHGLLTNFGPPIRRAFNGLLFDGSNDYITCGTGASLRITDAITLEIWVNILSLTATRSLIVKRAWGGTFHTGYLFTVSTAGAIYLACARNINEATATIQSDNSEIVINTWYHIIVTRDATYMTLYKNGNQLKQEASIGAVFGDASTSPLCIGMDSDLSSSPFSGCIALARAWNRVLIRDDARALFISPYAPYGYRMFL